MPRWSRCTPSGARRPAGPKAEPSGAVDRCKMGSLTGAAGAAGATASQPSPAGATARQAGQAGQAGQTTTCSSRSLSYATLPGQTVLVARSCLADETRQSPVSVVANFSVSLARCRARAPVWLTAWPGMHQTSFHSSTHVGSWGRGVVGSLGRWSISPGPCLDDMI
jgi:hypothetical protein